VREVGHMMPESMGQTIPSSAIFACSTAKTTSVKIHIAPITWQKVKQHTIKNELARKCTILHRATLMHHPSCEKSR
jgi:hypothetical protein